jgi:hypothetical protein
VRVEFVYGRDLEKLKEVSVNYQLDFFVVPVALSANGFQKQSKVFVSDEVLQRVLAGVWRARPQVEIAQHDLEFAWHVTGASLHLPSTILCWDRSFVEKGAQVNAIIPAFYEGANEVAGSKSRRAATHLFASAQRR